MVKTHLYSCLRVLFVINLITNLFFWSSVTVYSASPVFDDTSASSLLSKINSYRAGKGVGTLKSSSRLVSIAKSRLNAVYSSQTLINPGDPSHTIPGFGSFDAHAMKLGLVVPDKNGIGENFAISTSGVDGVFNLWLKSPSHLANITDNSFYYTGIATATNLTEIGDARIPENLVEGGVVAIQVFATKEVIDGPLSENNVSSSQPATETPKADTSTTTNQPTQKPTTTTNKVKTTQTLNPPKPTNKTPTKPKIDKTQKIGAKFKFEDLKIKFTQVFKQS